MTDPSPAAIRSLRDDLAGLGPFFAVEIHGSDPGPASPWQPMEALVTDSSVLASRIDTVRAVLADRCHVQPEDIGLRVAASVTHLGLIARLMAPAIAAAAAGCPLSFALEDLRWQDRLGGPFPLSVTPGPERAILTTGLAVESLTGAIAERYSVSDQVLWGNVGSASNSSVRLIDAARPDLSAASGRIADGVLADTRIAGGTGRSGPDYRRRSCCQIYLAAKDRAGTCADCILG